jgi:hypothetical protein
MKITKKDIGKKFILLSAPKTKYVIITDICKDEPYPVKGIEQYIDGTITKNGWSLTNSDWKSYKKPKKEWFNFRLFGCNEEHVRNLVKALDKRYKRDKK